MFDLANYQGNANQNHNEVLLIPIRMAVIKKNTKTNAGEDVEKRELSNTPGENESWYSHCEKQYGNLS